MIFEQIPAAGSTTASERSSEWGRSFSSLIGCWVDYAGGASCETKDLLDFLLCAHLLKIVCFERS
jgi:hypothetical protein